MQISILAIGRLKAGPEQELYDRFADRIRKSGKSLHISDLTLTEITESKSPDKSRRMKDEADLLLSAAGEGAQIILLDERGKDVSSRDFADLLMKYRDDGANRLCFAIGGPDGHGEAIKQGSVRSIRLGSMTWPHQIVRILLVEQIYRAITILSGHPYHRD